MPKTSTCTTHDVTVQGGHSPEEPGKHGTVREFKSGQGKVTGNGVLA